MPAAQVIQMMGPKQGRNAASFGLLSAVTAKTIT